MPFPLNVRFACAVRLLLVLLLSDVGLHALAGTTPSAVVSTTQGLVSGQVANGVRHYLGMPYAQAPVGPLRWQPPQPAMPWSDTRDGTQFGHRCPQPASLWSDTPTSEDCLFLNVYAPERKGAQRLPVMVWLHGGAFFRGAGSDYNMSTLASKGGVVVVSINYRLGVFGFFSQAELQAQGAASNFGFQDQQAALRWVRNEISQFGGDPGNVTIFGESAGGVSICMHLVSPSAQGLFQRVISQSGPCKLVGRTPVSVLANNGNQLGQRLSCPMGLGQLACMKKIPSAALLASSGTNVNFVTQGLAWGPVQDGVTLTGPAEDLINGGQFAKVPVLLGSNHDEGRLFVASEYHLVNLLPVSPSNLAAAIERSSQGDAAIRQQLSSAYTSANYGTRDKALGAMLTDELYACDTLASARAFAQFVPTYLYEFNEPYTPGAIDPYMQLGAFHGAELRYLFQKQLLGPTLNLPLSKKQQAFADQIVAYWAGFATTGNPNARNHRNRYWPRYGVQHHSILSLQSAAYRTLTPTSFMRDHRCDLWRR